MPQYRTIFRPTQSVDAPYVAENNYRLTRAMWFALYAPDSGRHDALLAEDVPDVYRRLFDAILDGSAGLARVALAGGEELALLETVARLPRPRQIPTRRLPLPDNPDLAEALFGRVAEALELDGVGVGHWPGMPSHTCAAAEAVGTVITFRGNRTSAARMYNPTWRTCPACQHLRAQRIGRQTLLTIAAHGHMTYRLMPAGDFRRWTGAQRQRLHRGGEAVHYRAMPQESGEVFVLATGPAIGAAVPLDRAALHTLISDHCVTPEGKNCSSSRGFGGPWQRLRGDGREEVDENGGRVPAVQRWTDSALEAVAAALGAAVRPGRDRISVLVDEATARERLHLAGVALRDKRHVTHLVQRAAKKKKCTKCVTAAARARTIAPPVGSTESAAGGGRAAQCAMPYL